MSKTLLNKPILVQLRDSTSFVSTPCKCVFKINYRLRIRTLVQKNCAIHIRLIYDIGKKADFDVNYKIYLKSAKLDYSYSKTKLYARKRGSKDVDT